MSERDWDALTKVAEASGSVWAALPDGHVSVSFDERNPMPKSLVALIHAGLVTTEPNRFGTTNLNLSKLGAQLVERMYPTS